MQKNTLVEFTDILFGPSDVQLILAKSEDRRFKRYLSTIENIRIALFPVHLALVILAGILLFLCFFTEFLMRLVSTMYMFSIDCGWLSPGRFGITKETYIAEFTKLKG